jgi:hypothetical protein
MLEFNIFAHVLICTGILYFPVQYLLSTTCREDIPILRHVPACDLFFTAVLSTIILVLLASGAAVVGWNLCTLFN